MGQSSLESAYSGYFLSVRDGAGEIVESACCDSVLSNPQCREVIEYLSA